MIKIKNLLAENMIRFRTKNLSEQTLNTMADNDGEWQLPRGWTITSGKPTDPAGNRYDWKDITGAYQKLKVVQQKIDELLKNVKLEAERRKDDLEKNPELTAREIWNHFKYKTYGLEDQIIEMQKFYSQIGINGSRKILDELTHIVERLIDSVTDPNPVGDSLLTAKIDFLFDED
jgi:alpha-ketoglutarate-dependent taurine dioxygenase